MDSCADPKCGCKNPEGGPLSLDQHPAYVAFLAELPEPSSEQEFVLPDYRDRVVFQRR